MKLKSLFSAMALAAVATSALAIVDVNSAGEGFIGKGDVQTLFSFNNKQMQQAVNSNFVSFQMIFMSEIPYTCEWYTGPVRKRTHHVQKKKEEVTTMATLAADPKKTGQWTGWFLKGVDESVPKVVTGDTPVPGQPCPAENGAGKTVGSVGEPVAGTAGSGLFATITGQDPAQRQLVGWVANDSIVPPPEEIVE